MIRCIPVDGSEPFEVGEHDLFERIENGERVIDHADRLAGHGTTFHWTPGFVGRRVECRIESWRERAERLERELDIVRLARDWSEAQHSFEHGDPDAMTDIGAIEAELKALGVTREEAMQL